MHPLRGCAGSYPTALQQAESRKLIEIAVAMKNRNSIANCASGDETVHR